MPLPDDIEAYARGGGSKSGAARHFRVTRNTVRAYWPKDVSPLGCGARPAEPTVGSSAPAAGFEEKADGTAVASFVTPKYVQTEEEALAEAKVDRTVWFVERMRVNAWQVGMKLGKAGAETVHREQLWQVTLHLKRIVPKSVAAALELVFARFKDAAPRWPKVEKDRPTKDEPFLAVFGLFDVHFGKLAWAPEAGEHYDLRIAEAMFRNAVEDLIAESRHRRVGKVLLPVGNDWFHVDARNHTTTRGTPQDVDGRFSKMLATGTLAAVWAVETLAAVAPVQVELIPGNHDRTLAECLCHVLAHRFHHTDRVTVGLEPTTRKYVRYGSNLIGLTHGDLIKPADLPNYMPVDAKRDWAETDTHEWLTGHGHRAMKWTTKDTDTHRGTVVRQLRALTRTDLWHYDHGFCGQAPAAEVYWYGRDRGYAGHAVVPARGAA